jgi:hypothetical protein
MISEFQRDYKLFFPWLITLPIRILVQSAAFFGFALLFNELTNPIYEVRVAILVTAGILSVFHLAINVCFLIAVIPYFKAMKNGDYAENYEVALADQSAPLTGDEQLAAGKPQDYTKRVEQFEQCVIVPFETTR